MFFSSFNYLKHIERKVKHSWQSSASGMGLSFNFQMLKPHFNGRKIKPNSIYKWERKEMKNVQMLLLHVLIDGQLKKLEGSEEKGIFCTFPFYSLT